jgi:hypothetical protein
VGRGVALGAAVSFHLVLLILVLRLEIHRQDAPTDRPDTQRLQLRFLREQVPLPKPATAPAHQTTATDVRVHATQTASPSKPPNIQHIPPIISATTTPIAPTAPMDDQDTEADGGFHAQLLKAQRSSVIRGVPGSDVPRVPGIRLMDPDTQGARAVVRKVQRLFGIPSRHCIDVEAWRNLTPRQLSARHLSLDDLDRLDEEYHCNEPMGLRF